MPVYRLHQRPGALRRANAKDGIVLQIDLVDQLHENRPALLNGSLLQKPWKISEKCRNHTKICQRQRYDRCRELRANHVPITLIGRIVNKAILIEPRKPRELCFESSTRKLAWVFSLDQLMCLLKCGFAPGGRQRETTEGVKYPRFTHLCHTSTGITMAARRTPATTI